MKCKNDLTDCTCSDLQERLDSLKNAPHLIVVPEAMDDYEKRAKQNKEKAISE
jgi:hypothetical protein